MHRYWSVLCVCILSMLLLTGCWDRQELNDRAFVLASGVDKLRDGSVVLSLQVANPAKLGGVTGGGKEGKAFVFMEAKGKDVQDARQNIQAKFSRRVFGGHRRVIFIGEKAARDGLKDLMDEFTRNPEVRMRTELVVIPGGEARREIKNEYTLERIPAVAALRLLTVLGGRAEDTMRALLMDMTSESGCATLPEVKHGKYVGRAIFDRNLRMVGHLSLQEVSTRHWIKNQLRHFLLTTYIPEGKGFISVSIRQPRSQIKPVLHGNQVDFYVTLSGIADVDENESRLDITSPRSIEIIKQKFESMKEKDVIDVTHKVQTKYRTDIFGFGEAVHHKYPNEWKQLKKNWQQTFSKSHIYANVNLKIDQIGLTGHPLQLKKGESTRK